MIFYDEYDKFLGADKRSLEFFDCKDIEEFSNTIGDVSNLFVKKDGYVYKFDNYSWLDYVNYSDEATKKVLIKKRDGEVIEAEIEINEIYPVVDINDSEVIYGVEFKNFKNFKMDTVESQDRVNVPEELRQIDTKISIDVDKNAQEMDIDEEFYVGLLEDFLKENNKYLDMIEDSILKSNYANLSYVVSILKSVTTNLKLNDLMPVLNAIERDIRNKNYKSIEKFIDIYKKEVESIKFFIDKKS